MVSNLEENKYYIKVELESRLELVCTRLPLPYVPHPESAEILLELQKYHEDNYKYLRGVNYDNMAL